MLCYVMYVCMYINPDSPVTHQFPSHAHLDPHAQALLASLDRLPG